MSDRRDTSDSLVGRTLAGRYRIDELLARGGMARVYRARDERLDRQVAVKVLSSPYADDPAARERFLAEARAAASVSHPSFVHVYDSGEDSGVDGEVQYIVMELLDRHRSLRAVLDERGRLGVEEAGAIGRQLLGALSAIHARGLVHCDVKAANVMLGPGPPKLIDFGIIRASDEEPLGGTSIGSLGYMSPEQLGGRSLTPASDLYAVGVVLYEALTGRLPFRVSTADELARAQAAGELPAPSSIASGIPARLDAAVLQALRPDPAARYHSADAMRTALESVRSTEADDETREVPTPPALPAMAPAAPDAGYVPPVVEVLDEPMRPPPPRRSPSQPPRRPPPPRRVFRLIGTAAVIAAAALVGILVVVPLIQLGQQGAGDPQASESPSSAASAVPTAVSNIVVVPETIGMTKDEAIEAANAVGLDWEIRCNHDEDRPSGSIDQEPAAGTEVRRGSRFTMYSARIGDCG